MGNIVLLDELTINKIAAGEVIERPASIVKELVENSIDAGSTNILIEIKNGGKTFIKVSDNGKGILFDDMQIAIERHSTSKIRKIEDLENTYTMGFRGEALSSIVSISKTTIVSRTEQNEYGIRMVIESGKIVNHEEIGTKIGTSITVENLFFNTPVRFKFLKQDSTEFRYIKELVQKMALANPNISFKLISNEKIVFLTRGSGKIEDIIYTLYGKEANENLIKVNYEEYNIKITGIIGNTLMARESRKDQIIFLNKRNIKNQILTNSADQAFKGATGINKYGFFILDLQMPASYYDVNVHPTKLEVRFKDESKIYRILYHAIKDALLNKDFLGNSEIENKKEEYIENEYSFLTNHFEESNNLVKKDEVNKELIIRVIRENKRNVNYRYIGVLFKTYIIIEIDEEIYLIDQHAAHERILYEKIKENYKNNLKNNIQITLFPKIYNLTHKEILFVQENIHLLKSVGFDLEIFGEETVKINGIPDIEYKANKDNIFLDILDEMIIKERTSIKDIEERFLATVACKAAVKAGMNLSATEVDSLIQNLLNLKNPYTCPHGRPTTIKITKEEIVKKCRNK